MKHIIKTCGCGAEYTREQWDKLEYVGPLDKGTPYEAELRNCNGPNCPGSTIAIELKTNNAEEES